jgi:hypothetical protein
MGAGITDAVSSTARLAVLSLIAVLAVLVAGAGRRGAWPSRCRPRPSRPTGRGDRDRGARRPVPRRLDAAWRTTALATARSWRRPSINIVVDGADLNAGPVIGFGVQCAAVVALGFYVAHRARGLDA